MAEQPFELETLSSERNTQELKLRGRVYADGAPELKAALNRLADDGLTGLLVDARELDQIDSAGLNVFVQLLKQIRPRGGRIVFYGLNQNVRRVFDITKLVRVMGVEERRADAVAALEGS